MGWVRITSLSVQSGSQVVSVASGSTSSIKAGDALLIDGYPLVEVSGVFAEQLQLKKAWTGEDQHEVSGVIVPTFGDFNDAVKEIRQLRETTANNYAEMERFWTSMGHVTFSSYDGQTFTFKTAKQTIDELSNLEAQMNQAATTAVELIGQYDEQLGEAYARVIAAQNASQTNAQVAQEKAQQVIEHAQAVESSKAHIDDLKEEIQGTAEQVRLQSQEVENSKAQIHEYAQTVAAKASQVAQDAQTVASKLTLVQQYTQTTIDNALQTAENAQVAADHTEEAKQYAQTTKEQAQKAQGHAESTARDKAATQQDVVTSQAHSAQASEHETQAKLYSQQSYEFAQQSEQWADAARRAAKEIFVSGGHFTPTDDAQYPDYLSAERDTVWMIAFAHATDKFTYTSGLLNGQTVMSGDQLLLDVSNSTLVRIPNPSAAGIMDINGLTGTSLTLKAEHIPYKQTTVNLAIEAIETGLTQHQDQLTAHNSQLTSLKEQHQTLQTDCNEKLDADATAKNAEKLNGKGADFYASQQQVNQIRQTTINGHSLDKDITLTAKDLGIDNTMTKEMARRLRLNSLLGEHILII